MNLWLEKLSNPWALIGILGQLLFFSRWIVQWVASEKKKQSHVPLSFWLISLLGGFLVFSYAVQQKDFVFVVGQSIGIANYTRNIFLICRQK